MRENRAYRRVLWHLLGATRGGPTRVQILSILRERPRNTNQLAVDTGLDYKTVEHHLRVLRENHVILATSEGYAATYALSFEMERHLDEFNLIASEVRSRSANTRSNEGAA